MRKFENAQPKDYEVNILMKTKVIFDYKTNFFDLK